MAQGFGPNTTDYTGQLHGQSPADPQQTDWLLHYADLKKALGAIRSVVGVVRGVRPDPSNLSCVRFRSNTTDYADNCADNPTPTHKQAGHSLHWANLNRHWEHSVLLSVSSVVFGPIPTAWEGRFWPVEMG